MPQQNDILNELKHLQVAIPCVDMPKMELPSDYFDKINDLVLNEIKSTEFLDSLPKYSSFDTPPNYFETLPDTILALAKSNDFITSLPKQNVYNTPLKYFDQLENELISQVHSDDFIATLPKYHCYEVPTAYFENLSAQIMAKTIKIHTISPLRATRTFYSRMAIAASMILVMGIGFLWMTQKPLHSKSNIEMQLAQLSDAEINTYIQAHAYEFEHQISYQKIDESKIDLKKLENDIYNSYFEDISDEELKEYL